MIVNFIVAEPGKPHWVILSRQMYEVPRRGDRLRLRPHDQTAFSSFRVLDVVRDLTKEEGPGFPEGFAEVYLAPHFSEAESEKHSRVLASMRGEKGA